MVGLTVGDLEGVRVGSFVRFDSVGDTVGNKDGGNAVAIAKDGREEYQIRMCEIFINNTKFRHTQT